MGATAGVMGGKRPVMDAFGQGHFLNFFALLALLWGLKCRPRHLFVAILAQGTSWAVAVTQAFLLPGSILVGCTWQIVHGVAKPSVRLSGALN